MRIGILGARGIPACYSGYDTLVEELALGLVQQHDTEVVVYCRSNYYFIFWKTKRKQMSASSENIFSKYEEKNVGKR